MRIYATIRGMPRTSSLSAHLKYIGRTCAFLAMTLTAQTSSAAIYGGPGITAGLNALGAIAGIPTGSSPRAIITKILQSLLSFMSLMSVFAIIVAGIYLVVGFGSDESKEKAKKIILYTLVGLMIILFSQVIVSLVTSYLVSQIGT